MGDSLPQLRIRQELELPDSLKYTKYSTDVIANKSEIQLEEMAYVSYPASTLDSSSISFNLPSISGGSIKRTLEHEIPFNVQFLFQGLPPDLVLNSAAAAGAVAYELTLGSSPIPFNTHHNTIDQFPLSKVFGTRQYTINNASTVLQEKFLPHTIDALAAMLDIRKMENDNLAPFAACNGHFRQLSYTCGGALLPVSWLSRSAANQSITQIVDGLRSLPSSFLTVYDMLARETSLKTRFASESASTWQATRNRGRNIVSIKVNSVKSSVSPNAPFALSTVARGFNNIQVPVIATTAPAAYQTTYDANSYIVDVTIVVREQMLSNFWYNDYQHDNLIFNQLLPASALTVKYDFNNDYLQNAFLQIGDNVRNMLVGIPASATIANVAQSCIYSITKIAIEDQTACKLNIFQQKVPVHFQDKNAYKLMFYDQIQSQGSKPMTFSTNNTTMTMAGKPNELDGVYTATQNYANLSQIPEYIQITLPVNRQNFNAALFNNQVIPPTCTLPSILNLPIDRLTLTFGNETSLATYGLDRYQLEKFTIQNLQEFEYGKDIIVGKSVPVIEELKLYSSVVNDGGAPLNEGSAGLAELVAKDSAFGTQQRDHISPSSGISNGSFYLLKIGQQIRLPANMCPSMIVTYNLDITATCDTSKFLKQSGYYDDMEAVRQVNQNISALSPPPTIASLDTQFFVRRIMTLSGQAFGTLYVHNVLISSGEYIDLLNSFKSNFAKLAADDSFDTRMMVGGSWFNRVKKAVSWLAPRVKDVANAVSKGADWASQNVGSGYAEHQVVGGAMMTPNDVIAGRKPRGKVAAAPASVNWRQLL